MGRFSRKNVLLFLSLVFSAFLYVFDVGSDIALAVRYFIDEHYNWAICTTVFVAVPWILLFLLGLAISLCLSNAFEKLCLLISGIFNLHPVTLLLLGMKELCMDEDRSEAKALKSGAIAIQIIEVIFEALPQSLHALG